MVQYSTYKLNPGELSGAGPRRGSRPIVFVAFPFADPLSTRFREELELRLRRSEVLAGLSVTDGHVPIGTTWASTVRDRLKRARLVVAELSKLNPEVLFECGLAAGFNRPILPVVNHPTLVTELPRWLTDLQIGNFHNEGGWNDLLSVLAKWTTPSRNSEAGGSKLPDPVPAHSVLLTAHPWLIEEQGAFQHICQKSGLPYRFFSLHDHLQQDAPLLQEAAKASLLIMPIDEQPSDSFVHFAAGVVSARPNAGEAKRKLSRKVLLVIADNQDPSLVADSARRRPSVVKVVRKSKLRGEIQAYAEEVGNWRESLNGGPIGNLNEIIKS